VTNIQRVAAFFVRAKHWQIFLLIVGVGWVVGGFTLYPAFARARSPEEVLRASVPFEIAIILSMLFFVAWLWSMGSLLSSFARPALRMRQGFFRFATGYAAVYMFVFFAAFDSANPVFLVALIPLHFFAFFCVFYDLYFASKSLALAETGKPVFFSDYAGAFFLLWFFPIGIWFIQPRINRLCGSTRENVSGSGSLGTGTQMSGYVSENQTAPPVYAGFWRRFAAMLIDGTVIFFPVFILFFFAFVVLWRLTAGNGGAASAGVFTILVAMILLAPWLYFSLLESSRWQSTVGKSALRLYVADVHGHRLSRRRSMGRNLAKFVSTVTLGVGYLMCGFTSRKQALHDIIARSVVLRRTSATKISH
jgi:uncharacterized RDD family membrane protein YckC